MANILKHRFASAKADGADATQVQPSHWNDGHAFSGGNAGDLLIRDPTDATYGAKWGIPVTPWTPIPYSAGQFFADGAGTVTAGVNLHRYRTVGPNTVLYQFTGNMAFSVASSAVYFSLPFSLDDLNQILPVIPRGPFEFFQIIPYNATLMQFKRCDNTTLSPGTYYAAWAGVFGITP